VVEHVSTWCWLEWQVSRRDIALARRVMCSDVAVVSLMRWQSWFAGIRHVSVVVITHMDTMHWAQSAMIKIAGW